MSPDGERGEAFTQLAEAERRTDDRISQATDRISTLEGKQDGIVTYKDVLLKFMPLVIGAVGAGATIVIATAKILP